MVTTWIAARCVLQYAIILTVLMACSPPAPLAPTTSVEVGLAATRAADTNPSLLSTLGVTPASTVVESPLQSPTTEPSTHMAIVDQSSAVDVDRAGWWSIQTLGPVGQTFKPAFAGLDAIELWTEDQCDEVRAGAGARLQVNIHEATIDGPLIGTSLPVGLPDCFKGITLFGFPSLIALTPDKVYVIEVVVASGDNWGVVWQQIPDSYPRGESVVLGMASNADIWFQAGLHNSTPVTEAYCQNNLWQYVRRADGQAFSDQGECIQYVNTRS
jgi:hypothetical protein